MKKGLCAIAALIGLGLFAAPASAQVLTVINQAGVSPRALHRVEAALQQQAPQLRAWWHTPRVTFGPGGWSITLQQPMAGPTEAGSHTAVLDPNGIPIHGAEGRWVPVATVSILGQPWQQWAPRFSHEILEMLVDPYGGHRDAQGNEEEVCDPVQNYSYWLAGVPVSDFALPAYFAHRQGQLDFLGILRRG